MLSDLSWTVSLMLACLYIKELAWSARSSWRGRAPTLLLPLLLISVNLVSAVGQQPPWPAIAIGALLVANELRTATRAQQLGVSVLYPKLSALDRWGWPGVWTAAAARRRLDRSLRRPGGPAPAPPDEFQSVGFVAAVLDAAAREAGEGRLADAVQRLDEAVLVRPIARWPDGTLGLLLFHRTVYAGLAAAVTRTTVDDERVTPDLALARTVLPDVLLGWLADAALALAHGRSVTVRTSASAVADRARGEWERGLAGWLLATQLPPGPEREERLAAVKARDPWLHGLATAVPAQVTMGP